jgi:GT2 family glycosyltransferase
MTAIGFIFVNYNNTVYSKKLLESLERQKGWAEEFYVECVVGE